MATRKIYPSPKIKMKQICEKGHGWLNLDGTCSACKRVPINPEIGFVFRNGDIGECTVTKVWESRFGDWKVSYADKRGGGGMMNLDYFTERFGTVTTEHHFTAEERWHPDEPPNNRPQDGRVCQCEDAPCCGCYSLR